MIPLSERDIKYLQGVGPQRAALLQKELNIHTFGDLLYYFPYKYVDRSRVYRISELTGSMPYVQLRGQILSFEYAGEGRQRRLIAHFSDGSGIVDLVWFQGHKYVTSRYRLRTEYLVFGRPALFGGRFQVAHPELGEIAELDLTQIGLQPYYSTTEKMKRQLMHSHALERIMRQLMVIVEREPLIETLPTDLCKKLHLISRTNALRQIHFPRSADDLRQAQYRLKFEELFYIQLQLLRLIGERRQKYRGLEFKIVGEMFNRFYAECLPFSLTGAQKRVIKEMRHDLGSGHQMNRLLQGDVGSGKTLVALMTMLLAKDNGFQACMMAPTEILATQHYQTLISMLSALPVRVELLTGSIRGKRRERILSELLMGEIDFLVGTHAVIEETVQFHSLGLVVIDEQHRFGVAQRARLWTKNDHPPHILVMTATPIPRTLAMTLYGDLEVSVIDELPPGRKPIQTLHQFDNRRTSLYNFLRKEIQSGRQVYVVYPLIEESETLDIRNLEEGYSHLCETFPEYQISKVHGKMKAAEKEIEMQRFQRGETQILVATTVIEVGVNVPNASVMVIENAERFGLSQLHQLRGRVGRGAEQSYCILVTRYELSKDTRRRMEIMVGTTDGFAIAEADLKLRGPGDLEGTRQSGFAFDLRIADLARDGQILQLARDCAEGILARDPELSAPEHAMLPIRIKELRTQVADWSVIS